MARSKKFDDYSEEVQREFDERVKQKLREEREIRYHQGRIETVRELLRYAITMYKWEMKLDLKFVLELYRFLINNSDLTEADKDDIEYDFAENLIFVGTNGLPAGTNISEKINEVRNDIKKYRDP